MTRLLEQAFETIRKLPDPVQDDLARLLLEIADGETQCVTLTSEEESDLTEALAEVERGGVRLRRDDPRYLGQI